MLQFKYVVYSLGDGASPTLQELNSFWDLGLVLVAPLGFVTPGASNHSGHPKQKLRI